MESGGVFGAVVRVVVADYGGRGGGGVFGHPVVLSLEWRGDEVGDGGDGFGPLHFVCLVWLHWQIVSRVLIECGFGERASEDDFESSEMFRSAHQRLSWS